MTIRMLDDDERTRLFTWFDRLRNWENDAYVRKHSHKLDGLDNVYLLKTNDEFRIFFTMDGDTIIVLDIAHKDTLAKFEHVAE